MSVDRKNLVTSIHVIAMIIEWTDQVWEVNIVVVLRFYAQSSILAAPALAQLSPVVFNRRSTMQHKPHCIFRRRLYPSSHISYYGHNLRNRLKKAFDLRLAALELKAIAAAW